jgi:uncharacterized protein with HEPN domain
MRNNNISILEHIFDYCVKIENAINRFGDSELFFSADEEYRDAVCMRVLQIGELTTLLSDDFKDSTKSEMDWIGIKKMRNLFAHAYHQVKSEIVWETIKKNVPELKIFCENQISSFTLLSQDGNESAFEDLEDYDLDL